MVGTQRRTLFLTGAPTSSSLKWTEADLSAALQPCYLRTSTYDQAVALTPDKVAPSWRFLPLEQAHLPTGLTQASREDERSQAEGPQANETSFFTTSDLSFVSTDIEGIEDGKSSGSIPDGSAGEILSQFYEHSFAVHNNILSSQIIGIGSVAEGSFNTETEDYSMELTAYDEMSSQEEIVRSRLTSGYLSDLKDVPNAAYLRSITPQTMTVSLVVGIISISQPRTIRTRKSGRIVELVEMLVGDETRAGFGINIWLPCMQEGQSFAQRAEDLRSSTSKLRPQDIVLARNVALSSFRGKVHGQSLQRGMTTLDLLYRNPLDSGDTRGAFPASDLESGALMSPQVLKVKKVKDWVMECIGTNARPPALDKGRLVHTRKEVWQPLPADTQ